MALIENKDKLLIERQKLNALLEITNAVNKNYKVSELIVQFENVMQNYIGIKKLAFVNKRDSWKCILNYGMKNHCNDLKIKELLKIDGTLIINKNENHVFDQFDIILPVFHKEKALSYLLLGGIEEDEMMQFIETHLGFVQTLANVVSVAIETKNLAKELIKKKLEEKDMKIAAEMQKLLLPANLPSNHLIDIAGTYIAKNMVSGDYYDFIRINKNEYIFCIADVSGKGTSAAMLMSNFQATLRANVKYNHANLTLKELVSELNTSVINAAKGEKFITFFIGYYNESNRKLKYVNAGHNFPILLHKGEIKELQTGCTPLGVFEELPSLESKVLTIEPNTIIVCYTDGMVEVENELKEQFESERLAKGILANSCLNMSEMNKALFREVNKFKGENDYPDDTALLSLRII
ncbi:MAG: PP2C family protein-serine/threonine phosphatase [Flavobacteriales bacterium]|jgi:sigma-B regulation protein RsbU (phosphoserine phosphatase)|nr:PP2C family protein-serine/threonine phosphatase [Flavobacteriales bacterium]